MGAFFLCTETEGFDSHIVHLIEMTFGRVRPWLLREIITAVGQLTQLVRVFGLHPKCRGFDSLIAHF